MNHKDPQFIIFRDDDVGNANSELAATALYDKFVAAHELYNKYNIIHELGYITGEPKRFQSKTANYILKQSNIIVQLHAHNHYDFTKLSEKDIRFQFENGIKNIKETFGQTPTRWYPPWHFTNKLTIDIAAEYGLSTAPSRASSIQHFVKFYQKYLKNNPPRIVCHHFWSDTQQSILDDALSKYTQILKDHFNIELV